MAEPTNETTQDIDLENNDVQGTDDSNVDTTADDAALELAELRAYKTKQEAIQRRIANKKTTTQPNPITPDLSKDIEEIKFTNKVNKFARENSLSETVAERVLKLYPNATAELLKDPFIAEGIKAITRKERIEDAMPGAGRNPTVGGKTFKDMTEEERVANFSQFIPK